MRRVRPGPGKAGHFSEDRSVFGLTASGVREKQVWLTVSIPRDGPREHALKCLPHATLKVKNVQHMANMSCRQMILKFRQ